MIPYASLLFCILVCSIHQGQSEVINVAIGAKCLSSSALRASASGYFPCKNAIDGINKTVWIADDDIGTKSWIYIDFGVRRRITNVRLLQGLIHTNKAARLEFSEGTVIKLSIPYHGLQTPWDKFDIEPVWTTGVNVVITGVYSQHSTMGWAEIQLFEHTIGPNPATDEGVISPTADTNGNTPVIDKSASDGRIKPDSGEAGINPRKDSEETNSTTDKGDRGKGTRTPILNEGRTTSEEDNRTPRKDDTVGVYVGITILLAMFVSLFAFVLLLRKRKMQREQTSLPMCNDSTDPNGIYNSCYYVDPTQGDGSYVDLTQGDGYYVDPTQGDGSYVDPAKGDGNPDNRNDRTLVGQMKGSETTDYDRLVKKDGPSPENANTGNGLCKPSAGHPKHDYESLNTGHNSSEQRTYEELRANPYEDMENCSYEMPF